MVGAALLSSNVACGRCTTKKNICAMFRNIQINAIQYGIKDHKFHNRHSKSKVKFSFCVDLTFVFFHPRRLESL